MHLVLIDEILEICIDGLRFVTESMEDISERACACARARVCVCVCVFVFVSSS
jgi:hypothetical protein